MKDFQISEEMMVAYIKGELDETTSKAVEVWYDESQENQKHLGQVYYILSINDRINAASKVDVEASLRQLKRKISANRRARIRKMVAKVAVAATILIAIATAGVTTFVAADKFEQSMMVSTQMGERSQVVLPDGSRVWLNSCSSISYEESFFSRKRLAKIEGEVYFEVKHDKNSPFIVSSNGLDIRVLGTRFNVRNDDELNRITTVLLEGSIKTYAQDNEAEAIKLKPSQQLFYDSNTGEMHLMECPVAERSINWISGKFYFDRCTFEEIVAELKRYYNIDVVFKDEKLKQERFSGNFNVQDGVYHIMSVLQLTYKFTYTVDGNNIIIYSKK